LHPADTELTAQAIRQVRASKKLVRGFVNRFITPAGTKMVEWNGYPLFDDEGRYAGLQGTGRDITERKRAEEEREALLQDIKKINRKLEESNKELQDFAYIASHDLREPLRNITLYAGFLLEDYKDRLDKEGRSKLESLVRLCHREEDLVQALLEYSRLGRQELKITEVDLNTLVREALESLFPEEHASFPKVFIPQPLPTIACDRVRMLQVFSNLISNAVKYNDHEEKIVEITAQKGSRNRMNGHWTIAVRDNGIGIQEKHIEGVFTLFKRLHGKNDYGGGVGAGLTIVKKIVETHGGNIWVESVPGQGSAFYFTVRGG